MDSNGVIIGKYYMAGKYVAIVRVRIYSAKNDAHLLHFHHDTIIHLLASLFLQRNDAA